MTQPIKTYIEALDKRAIFTFFRFADIDGKTLLNMLISLPDVEEDSIQIFLEHIGAFLLLPEEDKKEVIEKLVVGRYI